MMTIACSDGVLDSDKDMKDMKWAEEGDMDGYMMMDSAKNLFVGLASTLTLVTLY